MLFRDRRMRSSCPLGLKPVGLQIGRAAKARKAPVRQITSLLNAKGLGFAPTVMGRTAATKTAPCRHRAGTAPLRLCLGDYVHGRSTSVFRLVSGNAGACRTRDGVGA